MNRHLFTESAPEIVIPHITVPFDLAFTLTPPADWHPQAGIATRLLHCRTRTGKPRDTEVFEIKVSGNGQLVVELSGYGAKQAHALPPLKMGVPEGGAYLISYGTNGALSVNDHAATTFLKPTGEVELVFGFATPGAELVAPIGWTLEADFLPDTAEPPVPPPTPPSLPSLPSLPVSPPAPPSPPTPAAPQAPPTPATLKPAESTKDAFLHDLEALALKYAAAQGIDPLVLMMLQMLVLRLK